MTATQNPADWIPTFAHGVLHAMVGGTHYCVKSFGWPKSEHVAFVHGDDPFEIVGRDTVGNKIAKRYASLDEAKEAVYAHAGTREIGTLPSYIGRNEPEHTRTVG